MTRRVKWLPTVPLVILWFAGLASYPLLESTEGRYASVAWTMAHGGSWIEPIFNGLPLFTKPPLAYWAGAVALKFLPDTAWAVRLPASLVLLLCAWLTLRLAKIVGLTRPHGHWAAMMVCLSPLAVAQGHMTTGDIFLWAGVLVVFVGLLNETIGDLQQAAVIGLGLAVGFMAKGHMILFWIALPLLGWASCPTGDRQKWRQLLHPVVWLVFGVLAVPWFAVVLHRHPELQAYWLGSETTNRFLTTAHGRSEPWWYFLPQVPALMLPWLPELWRGLRRNWQRPAYRILLLAWIVTPLLVLTFSGSKRANYLLPMVTPLALIAACGLPNRITRSLRWRTGVWLTLVLVWPFILRLGNWGPPTEQLVAEATQAHRALAAYRTDPSALVFYYHGEVPLIGVHRFTPISRPAQSIDTDLKRLEAHFNRGGWVLLRASDLPGLENILGCRVLLERSAGPYRIVSVGREDCYGTSHYLRSPSLSNGCWSSCTPLNHQVNGRALEALSGYVSSFRTSEVCSFKLGTS